MKALGGKTLQYQSLIEELPKGRPRLENAKRRKKKRMEVLIQLGGTILSPRSRSWSAYHLEWLSAKIVPRT